ncbi:hypothetical protein D1871_01340 [Nakamurella silvestris]|nr:hypothetical protein D1871_01340 [Nakamurella silvestris]
MEVAGLGVAGLGVSGLGVAGLGVAGLGVAGLGVDRSAWENHTTDAAISTVTAATTPGRNHRLRAREPVRRSTSRSTRFTSGTRLSRCCISRFNSSTGQPSSGFNASWARRPARPAATCERNVEAEQPISSAAAWLVRSR